MSLFHYEGGQKVGVYCDDCGMTLYPNLGTRYYGENIQYAQSLGWVHWKEEDGWKDRCPDCIEAKARHEREQKYGTGKPQKILVHSEPIEKKAKWLFRNMDDKDGYVYCSRCEKPFDGSLGPASSAKSIVSMHHASYEYCPHCGAKMYLRIHNKRRKQNG